MKCRVCDASDLSLVIDLGRHPWCNHFLKEDEIGREPFYPLRVVFCHCCHTAQLDYTVAKEVMFGDHTYLSGITMSLDEHFRKVAQDVNSRFSMSVSSKSVLDIGSNDGTQLKHFQTLGYDVLGVESSKTTAKIANAAGIPTINDFFDLEVARDLQRKFNVINAAGVFFHLEELHSVTEGIKEVLQDDGVFVVQFLYMKRIIENLAFDQIYHEHLLYYNLSTIEVLLNRHGLEMFDAYLAPIHGGSMIGFVCHKHKWRCSERLLRLRQKEVEERSNECDSYLAFAERIKAMKARNLSYLQATKASGKTIFGYGAPVKGNTLLNYFGVGTDYINCLVEKNQLRRGLFSPGMHIPIVMEGELKQLPDVFYVLAWNFREEILSNNKAQIEKGVQFFFPVNPKPA